MRQAVVALIIKDGLILSISRRHDKNIFGLIGGKVEDGETLDQALIREVYEETGVQVRRCMQIYNHHMLNSFKQTFPEVKLIGE